MNKKLVNWIIILGLLILVVGILSPLLLNQPSNFELYNFDKNVNVAQSFSGYTMPCITFFGAVITFFAFYVQYEANQNLKNQFVKEQDNAHFYEMLKIHIDNIKEFRIESFYLNKTSQKKKRNKEIKKILKEFWFKEADELISENILPKSTLGRRCFVLMLKDLHLTIELASQENKKLTNCLEDEMLLKVAYRIFFWGINSHHRYPKRKKELTEEQINGIDNINNKLKKIQNKLRKKSKGTNIKYEYAVEEGRKVPAKLRFIPMSGHSTRLAHYYRHLYQTAKHVFKTSNHKGKEFLESDEIDFRFATLRAQMSNEEQLLFYYNYRIGFGNKWDTRYDSEVEGSNEFLFLSKYKMIHNIPLYDTIHNLVEHPVEHFKKYTDKYPNADLFEWS
jgi:hypothetical protein